MASYDDQIQLTQPVVVGNVTLQPGWYNARVSKAHAAYSVTNGLITIIDDGDVAGLDEISVMSEAPAHFNISKNTFSGAVQLKESAARLIFVNNILQTV